MAYRAIYVSSKLKHKDIWLACDLPISASWIHGKELPPEECSDMWERYRDEIEKSDAYLLYVEPEDMLKGCILEMGMAFTARIPIVIIWAGSIEDLAKKIGTIVYHKSVSIVGTLGDAKAMLGDPK